MLKLNFGTRSASSVGSMEDEVSRSRSRSPKSEPPLEVIEEADPRPPEEEEEDNGGGGGALKAENGEAEETEILVLSRDAAAYLYGASPCAPPQTRRRTTPQTSLSSATQAAAGTRCGA